MVTIKQIAELCGVSRGTVDRVLNQRGNVRADKAQLILDMAKKLNYKPNPAGKALVAQRQQPLVGILLPSKGIRFFDDVIAAMEKRARKYASFGLRVSWKLQQGYSATMQLQAIEELLAEGIEALIVNPINDECIIDRLNACIESGLFVVTVNNDVNIHRHCYVGSDYRNGGETMGALLDMLSTKPASIGVILGSHRLLGHTERLAGFQNRLLGSEHRIIEVIEDEDDEFLSYERTRELLLSHPEISALVGLSSGGIYGACRAAMQFRETGSLMILVFDTIPTTIDLLQKGVIRAAIYQHPTQQGQNAMQLVYDYLVNGIKPEKMRHIMKNDIRIKENV